MQLRFKSAAIGLLAIGLAAAPGGGSADTSQPLVLSLATGSVAGVYYPVGTALADRWSREIDSLTVEAEPTGGSIINVRLLNEGEAQLALVQSDIARYASHGEEMFSGTLVDGYRGVAMLYPEPIQIVTLAGSGITSVADLAGKRVAVGARGSGTELNARQILGVHGLDYTNVNASLMPFEDAATALRDGLIHAAIITAGTPTRAVTNLATLYERDVAIVPLAADRIAELVERWPFYSASTIPADTYPGVGAVDTVSVVAMLVAREDLDADAVERVLEILFSERTLARLCHIHTRGCDISLATALAAMPLPLHPGAERFYARHKMH